MTLKELAIQEYEDLTRKLKVNFQPLYPAVLIRVLPKEHISAGGLWLPDTKQNKPIYEGIVLRTYPPKRIQLDSGKWVTMDSGLAMGDHILFPHWSGEPVPWLRDTLNSGGEEEEEYRLLPARSILSQAGMRDSGEPYLIINPEENTLDEKLKKILEEYLDVDWLDGSINYIEAIKKIKSEFDIIVKIKASKTTSGV